MGTKLKVEVDTRSLMEVTYRTPDGTRAVYALVVAPNPDPGEFSAWDHKAEAEWKRRAVIRIAQEDLDETLERDSYAVLPEDRARLQAIRDTLGARFRERDGVVLVGTDGRSSSGPVA